MQTPLLARKDVIHFDSARLTSDLDCVGAVHCTLWVSAEGVESLDVVCRLCDVSPTGACLNVCDGFLRRPLAAAAPGSPHEYAVEMGPTAHRFRAGHALRLMVSSCDHPRIARNLGTAEPLAKGTRTAAARVRVCHSAGSGAGPVLTPSQLCLPVCSGFGVRIAEP